MSSEDEGVRRPGRASGNESPAHSNNGNDSGAENHASADHMDEDDNDDLFGSDGEDALGEDQYENQMNATTRRLTDC